MKKRIKEFYINEDGNALILVMLLVMCMMLIAGGVMAVAFSHAEISQAYKRTSNLYYAAQSGAEKMVDHINKILMKEMPHLIEKAANEAKNKVTTTPKSPEEPVVNSDFTKLKYSILEDENEENSSPYKGEFLLDNLYQELLKEKAIETIVGDTSPINENTVLMRFEYELKNERNKSLVEVKLKPKMALEKVTGFTVISTATLQKESDELSKIILEGDIIISDLIGHKELFLEEYQWKDENLIPNTFRSPILTFGDLVITDGAEVIINGDVRAKGYIPHIDMSEVGIVPFPELEEYGGIYVSHGGKLTIHGNIVTLANVHTMNRYNTQNAKTKITVTGDVFANSVAIEDDYPYKGDASADSRPIGAKVINQYITINGDVYVDNDIAIDRYVEGTPGIGEDIETLIKIDGSVYGIMNEDPAGKDPNKSSGIYAIGKKSRIEIGQHAFVHGNAFISFDGGKHFSHLYESMGEPYEDVGFLDNYINNVVLGDESYLTLKKDYIVKNKIKLHLVDGGNFFAYAPRMISANGRFFKFEDAGNVIKDDSGKEISNASFVAPEQLKRLFNQGEIDIQELLKISPVGKDGIVKWAESIDQGSGSPKIAEIINNAYNYLKKEGNPYNREYFSDDGTSYDSMYYYRGIQGYMFLKRDIFYKNINTSIYSDINTSKETPENMEFTGDIINSTVALDENIWTKDNPVYILESSSSDEKLINVSDFYDGNKPVETIIIDKGEGTISLYASDPNQNDFYGLIVSKGRVKFGTSSSINEFKGIIIAQGKNNGNTNMTTAQIVSGEYAGVLVEADDPLTITYDKDILFKVKCKNRAVKRAILDYLGLTNYVNNTNHEVNEVEPILDSPSINIENIQKVDFSSHSVLDIKNTKAYRGIRFEMKTLRQVDSES
ncbi:MAG: hypothetical protein GX209_00710 [Epulopiscium sp.]|nr:hypothetical protein [Candidatus Epulonipiscium sp.]